MEFKCSGCNYTSGYKANVQRHLKSKCKEENCGN